jgi:hypothetical protein
LREILNNLTDKGLFGNDVMRGTLGEKERSWNEKEKKVGRRQRRGGRRGVYVPAKNFISA